MANRRKAGEIRVLVVDYGPTRNLVMRYTCPITGRTVTRTSSTKNRKEALKEAGQWQAELQDGRYKPMSRATWEDLRLRYENEKMPEMEPGSAAGVSGKFDALERILNPNLLTELTIDRLELLKRTLAKETVTRKVGEETVEETIVRAPETVKGHMTVIMGALRWAKEHGLLREVPKLPKAKRVRGAKKMKGRPLSPQEFCLLLSKVEKVRPAAEVDQWKRLLWGLWWSGLRLAEAVGMTWDDPNRIHVRLNGEKSTLIIPGCQKNGQHTEGPIVPEFCQFLEATPESERTGLVFPLPFRRKDTISKMLSEIGEASGIVVDEKSGKFASAHDLRRSFGERWMSRVMPAVLQKLMRHASIETTLKYYAAGQTDEMSKVVWGAFKVATNHAPAAVPASDSDSVTLPVNSEIASS